MSNDSKLNIGLVFGDNMLLSAYAEMIGADLKKLTRQARRCDSLINVGGVFYIDVPEFLEKNKELQKIDKDKRQAEKANPSSRTTIETTDNPGILRGQFTRLTRLNAEHESELQNLPEIIATEPDPEKKRKLKERQDNLPVMIDSNKITLEKVEKRLKELGIKAGVDNADSDTESED